MRTLFVILGLLLTVIDATMKWLSPRLPATMTGIIDIGFHQNPGIAFDIFLPLIVLVPASLIIIGALVFFGIRATHHLARVGATLAILGACNNLIDRLVDGFTTDYIILLQTSAINLADILIIGGTILLLRYTDRNPQRATT